MKRVLTATYLSFMMMLMGTVILITGCNKESETYGETLVLTVDDAKVYLDEMMYHIMLAEMQGQLYASVVGDSDTYWNMENDEGVPMSQVSKDIAMENAIKYELLSKLAAEEGYVLTDEERELSVSKVENIQNNVQEDQLKVTELTKEKLIAIQDKIAIATRYYDDYVNDIGIDKEAIKGQFNIENYKQYDIEYIFAQEKEYDELVSLLDVAKTTDELTDLTKDKEVTSGKLSFLAGEGTFGEETNLEEVITVMDPGEVSDIVKTSKGYYILKLIDNTSTKKYDSAVKTALEEAVTEAFETEYETIKNQHKIKIENKVWDKINIGSTVLKEQL